jgi:4-amino-4-deoxy-L-arabinose transferase-like glycosyltransferase
MPRARQWTVLRRLLVASVVAYGALLRLDAISQKFAPVERPGWLHRLELSRQGESVLRPPEMRWTQTPRFAHKDGPPTQYRSDPYTYLEYAREMRSFYAAHRREPLFVFATKVWLWLVHGNDAAVSFAAASFSVLAIALIYLLGSETFSPWVGLAAAALWAIEFDVVSSGTDGWRDDAFTCAVVACAWLMLRYARQPQSGRAVALGIAAGAACLIRITSLSFLLPGFAYLVVTGHREWKTRLRGTTVAALVMLALIGPFLFNCWRVYGDPLYAIDVHADVYRAAESNPQGEAGSAGRYIAAHLRRRPLETIDTFVLGMTTYPFTNKWTGFRPWMPRLGWVLSRAALAGLFFWILLPRGRLLLVVLAASLVPYAFTWRLIADWRFTEHAYPFFLLAACSVPWCLVRASVHGREFVGDRVRRRRLLLQSAAAAAVVLSVWFVFTRMTPELLFEQTLVGSEPAMIVAGDRDAAFFGRDWRAADTSGPIPTRAASGERATIMVPLPAPAAYDVIVRVDVPDQVGLLWNGRYMGICDPGSTRERMGQCRIALTAGAVRRGDNRLTLIASGGGGLRVWYVRVIPAMSRASSTSVGSRSALPLGWEQIVR